MEIPQLFPIYGNVGAITIGGHGGGTTAPMKFHVEVWALTNDVVLTAQGQTFNVEAKSKFVGVMSLNTGSEIQLTQTDLNAACLYSVTLIDP